MSIKQQVTIDSETLAIFKAHVLMADEDVQSLINNALNEYAKNLSVAA